MAARHVEAALGGALLALLRHQTCRVRLVAQCNCQHLLGCRHLEIQRQVDFADQALDIAVGNMPAILAQMGGDAVGTRLRGQPRCAHRIGMPATPRIADGGHVIDVDAKT